MKVSIVLRKWVMLLHRWMGVAFCLLFFMWFVSGAVLMYVPFPELSPAERLQHMQQVDGSRIRVLPSQAVDAVRAATPQDVRLAMVLGRPAYRIRSAGKVSVVFADTGELFGGFDAERAQAVAAEWLREPANALRPQGKLTAEDQWTVPQRYRPLRPLWKFADEAGNVVYVSDTAAEVVDHTTRLSRWGSYFGAIPHWIYFTRLRRDAQAWSSVVIWVSSAGTLMTLLGLVAGVWLYSPRRRYRFEGRPTGVPFAGQKRWHMVLGYSFGLATLTWILSGLFSMTPIRWQPEPVETRVHAALSGGAYSTSREAFDVHPPQWAMTQAGSTVRELQLTRVSGKPAYLAWGADGGPRAIPLSGASAPAVDDIVRTVEEAAAPYRVLEQRVVGEYDSYYIDRHGEKPLPALFVRLSDPAESFFYIDPRDASVVESYGVAGRRMRWLYHGLHSLDLPWLYRNRPLWDVVVLIGLAGGAWLSVTAIVIAVQRVRRKARSYRQKRANVPAQEVLAER